MYCRRVTFPCSKSSRSLATRPSIIPPQIRILQKTRLIAGSRLGNVSDVVRDQLPAAIHPDVDVGEHTRARRELSLVMQNRSAARRQYGRVSVYPDFEIVVLHGVEFSDPGS